MKPIVSEAFEDLDAPRWLYAAQRDASRKSEPPSLWSRREDLGKLETMLQENRAEFIDAISKDFGHRSPQETELLELVPLLNGLRHARRKLARWMRPERRHVAWTFQPAKAWVQYQPLGVVGIVAPWNYPLLLSMAPLVDALAAGNRVLLKPSEYTPAFSALIERLIASTFPADQVAVVMGGPAVAAVFCSLPLDHLLFTGSTATGRKVALAAAANLTPVTLELGGKSPAVVGPDYSLARAARSIVFGKFVNAGQTCIAPDYVLAPIEKVQPLAEAILKELRHVYPSLAANPDYSSIIDNRQLDRLIGMLVEARAGGAQLLQYLPAGETADMSGKLVPTLIINPPANCQLMRDEIFGPLLPILGYRDLDDATAQIRSREHPLALYGFSNDREWRRGLLAGTLSGGVTLNGTLLHIAQDDLPFGGVGPSGIGAYHGHDGFKRFSHARAIHQVGFINGFELLRPPFGRLTRWVSRFLIGGSGG